jgi:hypothetical protein
MHEDMKSPQYRDITESIGTKEMLVMASISASRTPSTHREIVSARAETAA